MTVRLQQILRASVKIVDAEGEYAIQDTYARIAVIDAVISICISDHENDPATIEIEFGDKVVFRVVAESREEYVIEVFDSGEWEEVVLEYAQGLVPLNDWTFGE